MELAPGGRLAFASDSPIDLAPETLARRYAQRKLRNLYAVPASLPFLLDPYRRQWALAMLAKAKKAPLNTDLDPVAYFYLWKMWLAMFVSPATLSGLALLIVAFVLLTARLLRPGELLADKDAAGVFLAGFWAMGFATVCLFMFQTHSSQLGWKLGTLFSAFMAGSAAGAYALKLASRSGARAAALFAALALTAWLYSYAPDLGGMALEAVPAVPDFTRAAARWGLILRPRLAPHFGRILSRKSAGRTRPIIKPGSSIMRTCWARPWAASFFRPL